ncbi:class D sortase [Shewanella zhangzhouensis]|uniref:class D sortase n=1 Tax=Shewanella zhangzhouensis TaxID=2864213 RepID=UPI001C660AE3|nr:class D sortase [Shewanella zhangzhouensis]QYK06987.1 class D sortase [Shewanella zhangzhouensis]
MAFGAAKWHQAAAGDSALAEVDRQIADRSLSSEPLVSGDTSPATTAAISGDANPATDTQLSTPDMSDWSTARKKGFHELSTAIPLGKLTINDISLEVALFDGDSELNLNKGVARVHQGAALGESGNLVIAGHRDSFFRKLGQLGKGAVIDIMSIDGELHRYQITDSWILTPKDTWVMAPVSTDVLTLVTCYPFYFVGSAPQRYIVRAKKVSTNQH